MIRNGTAHVAFEVVGRPQPAGSKRAFVNKQTGKAIVTDDNARSRPWKQEVASRALDAMREGDLSLFTGPVSLLVDFYFARPKGHYGTGRNSGVVRSSAPEHHTVKPDATKLLRGVEDALTGVVYRDDAQIVEQHVSKSYGDTDCVAITVLCRIAAVYCGERPSMAMGDTFRRTEGWR